MNPKIHRTREEKRYKECNNCRTDWYIKALGSETSMYTRIKSRDDKDVLCILAFCIMAFCLLVHLLADSR